MSKMNRILLRTTIAAFAIVACTVLTQTTVFAQFDVDAYSPAFAAGGNAGEYPLVFDVEFNNGTRQTITVTANGVTAYEDPNDNLDLPPRVPVAWWFGGVRRVIPFNICIPWAGGCWCFCIKCTWPWWWWPRCRFIVYWNPCC